MGYRRPLCSPLAPSTRSPAVPAPARHDRAPRAPESAAGRYNRCLPQEKPCGASPTTTSARHRWMSGTRLAIVTGMSDAFLESQLRRIRELSERVSQLQHERAEISSAIERERSSIARGPLHEIRDVR